MVYNTVMLHKNLRTVFRKYISGELKLERWQKIGIFMLLIVFAGFFGWVYEFIFYYFNGGMKKFYMQGGNFLPWINIYAIGTILIILTTRKFRKYPWMVFLISVITTGLLEFVAGWLVFKIGNGTRYWDYNTEILNFGNIEGLVCLRSVLFFGVSALFLTYVVIPITIWLSKKMTRRTFLTFTIILFTLVMVDEIYNILASKFFDWPDAIDFYESLKLEYWVK